MTRQQRRAEQRAGVSHPPPWPTRLAGLPPGLRRWAPVGVVALAVVILFGAWPIWGGDWWMHLMVGRWTWAHGGVPRVDDFSFTTAGAPFIAHSWLAGVIFYLTEHTVGTVGLAGVRFALVAGALLAAVGVARQLHASWLAIIVVAPPALRPQDGSRGEGFPTIEINDCRYMAGKTLRDLTCASDGGGTLGRLLEPFGEKLVQ